MKKKKNKPAQGFKSAVTSPAACLWLGTPKRWTKSKAHATAATEGAARTTTPRRFDGVGDAECWPAEPGTREGEACRAGPGTGREREAAGKARWTRHPEADRRMYWDSWVATVNPIVLPRAGVWRSRMSI